MRKINLKAVFLSLLARRLRHEGDSPDESSGKLLDGAAIRPATAAEQPGIAGDSSVELTESGQKAAAARAEAPSGTANRIPAKPAGPPEDWLAKHSSEPPAHWVESVRQTAPELLQDQEKDKAGVTVGLPPSRQHQRKPAIPAPLRLERPTPARRSQQDQSGRGASYSALSDGSMAEFQSEQIAHSLSSDVPQEPIVEIESQPDYHSRLSFQKQEPAFSSFSVSSQKRDADAGERINRSGPACRSRSVECPNLGLSDLDLRETAETSQFQIIDLDEHQDRQQVREAPGIRRLESPIPATVTPVEVTQWKESSRIGARARVTSQRDAKVKSPSPVQAAEQITRPPDVIHLEVRRFPVHSERFVFDSGYRQVEKREEEVIRSIEPPAVPDRHITSYNASSDRWPTLPDAFSTDDFDEMKAVWRELSHRRHLTREQIGSVWSE